MNNLENSFYGSSVRSYRNLQLPPSQQPHLIKYLHTQQKLPSEDNKKIEYTPIIARNKSYDTFNKISDVPSRENNATISNRFYQSIVNSSSQQKYRNQVHQLQGEITRLMANQLGLKTEKELLRKENKQLNEEITYLSDKCTELQNKNEQLFKNQSRAVILERQYHKLQLQHESFKNNCRSLHQNHLSQHHFTNLPTRIEGIYELTDRQQPSQIDSARLRGKMMSPALTSNKFSQKVALRRVGSPPVSPIYKLDTYKKVTNRFEDVSLIESKIDKVRGDDLMVQREREREREMYHNQVKDHTKTLDLKDLEKIKDYDSNIRSLEQELKDLRVKNIALFKKAEEYERQKMKFYQDINELNYEKAKLASDNKIRENELKKQFQLIKLQSQQKQIKIIDFTQSLQLKTQQLKLLSIQKRQLQQRIQALLTSKQLNQQHLLKLGDSNKKIEEYEKQLVALKQKYTLMSKRKDELQIQCKLYVHQLEDKKQSITSLQSMVQKLKQQMNQKNEVEYQKDTFLKEQSILNKPKTKAVIQENLLNADQAFVQTDPIQLQPKLLQQLLILRNNYLKLQTQHNIWGYQLNKLRVQNNFLNDNYLKLSQINEQMRVQNIKLKELSVAWRQIEMKAFSMKHMDEAVDHLWQVKEVQYQNLHSILNKIPES